MKNETFIRQIKNQKKHWWFQSRKIILKKVIENLKLKPRANILDFGCGSGVNIQILNQFGYVEAHEKNLYARLNLKKNKNIKKIYHNLKFKKNFYDLILLADVIEHIQYPKKILNILKKSLKPDGYILLTVPAYQCLYSKKDFSLGHFRRYNKKILISHAKNFKIVKLSYFNTFLFLPIAIVTILNKFFNRDYIEEVETTPYFIINRILFYIFSLEKFFINIINFPFGLSILAVIKK